jgi:hypothetical protein
VENAFLSAQAELHPLDSFNSMAKNGVFIKKTLRSCAVSKASGKAGFVSNVTTFCSLL